MSARVEGCTSTAAGSCCFQGACSGGGTETRFDFSKKPCTTQPQPPRPVFYYVRCIKKKKSLLLRGKGAEAGLGAVPGACAGSQGREGVPGEGSSGRVGLPTVLGGQVGTGGPPCLDWGVSGGRDFSLEQIFHCDMGAGDCETVGPGAISDTSLKRAPGRSSVTDKHIHVCNSHPSSQEGMSHVL